MDKSRALVNRSKAFMMNYFNLLYISLITYFIYLLVLAMEKPYIIRNTNILI